VDLGGSTGDTIFEERKLGNRRGGKDGNQIAPEGMEMCKSRQ